MSEYTTNIMSIHYKIVTRDMPENVKLRRDEKLLDPNHHAIL